MDSVTAISTSEHHSAAIKTDGTLWEWGWNPYYKVFADTANQSWSDYRQTPVKFLDNVSAVSAGDNYEILAIKTDGTLWFGRLTTNGGDGYITTYEFTPVSVK